jgi:uncharacterized protein involved in exopolysaccharide biosynthesis
MTHPRPPQATDPLAAAIVDWAFFVRRHLLALLIVFVVAAAASVAYTLHLPNRYTATAEILPHVPPPPIAGTSELIGEAALGATPASMATLYAQVAQSRSVLAELLTLEYHGQPVRAILARESGEVEPSDAELVEQLGSVFRFEINPRTYFVHASATHRDPYLAADLLSGLLERLDYHIQHRTDKGFAYTRDILETRREQVSEMQRLAQERLQTFERDNPARDLPGELLARRDALRSEVESAADLYRTVSDQCELARVAEQHYASLVSVLDRPEVPERKSGPPRGKIVIVTVVIAMLAAVVYMRANDAVRQHLAVLAADAEADTKVDARGGAKTGPAPEARAT